MNPAVERLVSPFRDFSQRIRTGAIERVIFHHHPKAPEPNQESVWERFPELKGIPADKFPKHVFIIPDGNRRFANANGHQEAIFGHMAGYKKTMQLLETMSDLPIDMVTLWAFSDNNWGRPEPEKQDLMELFGRALGENVARLQERNVKFVHLGRRDRIPQSLAEDLSKAEELTKDNTGQTVCIALDYGGDVHEENIAKQSVIFGVEEARRYPNLSAAEIAERIDRDKVLSFYNGGGSIPPADLLIRAGYEKRTSDPGLLEGAETELFFIDKLFPEVEDRDIVDGIISFASRKRRLGK